MLLKKRLIVCLFVHDLMSITKFALLTVECRVLDVVSLQHYHVLLSSLNHTQSVF